jgi:hypothetical protein
VRNERVRAETAETSNFKLDASLLAEKRQRMEEAMAWKAGMEKAVEAVRNSLLSQFADAQGDFNRLLARERADFEKQLVVEKNKCNEQRQLMCKQALEAETKWQIEIEKFQNERSEMIVEMRRLVDTEDRLMGECAKLQKMVKVMDKVKAERVEFRAEVAQLKTERALLREEAGRMRGECECFRDEVVQNEQKAALLQDEVDGLKAQLATGCVGMVHQRVETLGAVVVQNEQRAALLQEEVDGVKEQLQSAGTMIMETLLEVDGVKQQLQSADTMIMETLHQGVRTLSVEERGEIDVIAAHETVLRSNLIKGLTTQHFQELELERSRTQEAVRVLRLEQEKVQELEKAIALGVDAIAEVRLAVMQQRMESAEQAAGEQKQKTARAEEQCKEMQKRVDGAGVCLGDYHAAWQQGFEENKALKAQVLKTDRLRQEAVLKAEDANKTMELAWSEVAKLQGQAQKGPVAADLQEIVKAMEESDHGHLLEAAARRTAESKLAAMDLQHREAKGRVVQLQTALREVEGRAAEMASVMRSGPFRFGGRW